MTASGLRGDTVMASDGPIGRVHDVYFDEERWTVRYLLVDTGESLPGGLLLVPPASVSREIGVDDALRLDLTRAQAQALICEGGASLRSGAYLLGLSVLDEDRLLGEVDDFSLDERWRIRELEVRDNAGARLRVRPEQVVRIDPAEGKLYLRR